MSLKYLAGSVSKVVLKKKKIKLCSENKRTRKSQRDTGVNLKYLLITKDGTIFINTINYTVVD